MKKLHSAAEARALILTANFRGCHWASRAWVIHGGCEDGVLKVSISRRRNDRFWRSRRKVCVACTRINCFSKACQIERLAPRAHGPVGPRAHGPTAPRPHGPTGTRPHRSTGPQAHGPTGPRAYGPTRPRAHGPAHGRTGPQAHGPTCPRLAFFDPDYTNYGVKKLELFLRF